uniref:Uncharacterized protein n=1 Tax=Rhizophora mucronata TaxID=61149 RepID=A0A2P2R0C0_RHIMU
MSLMCVSLLTSVEKSFVRYARFFGYWWCLSLAYFVSTPSYVIVRLMNFLVLENYPSHQL